MSFHYNNIFHLKFTMKWTSFLVLLILPCFAFSQQLPDFYHTYDELIDSLTVLEAAHPNIMDMFIIGTSTEDSLPIHAVKLSDSVDVAFTYP